MTKGSTKVQNELYMKSKLLVFIIIIVAFLFSVSRHSVSAVTDTSTAGEKRMDIQQKMEEKEDKLNQVKEEVRKRVEARKATQEAEVKERRRERLEFHWGILEKRILATINRLMKLTERIESRIAKIKESNPEVDTEDIEEQVTEAKSLLEDAKLKYDEAKSNMLTLLEAEDPKAAFEDLKESISDIKDTLVDVHRMLVLIIGDIRGLRVGNSNLTPVPTIIN